MFKNAVVTVVGGESQVLVKFRGDPRDIQSRSVRKPENNGMWRIRMMRLPQAVEVMDKQKRQFQGCPLLLQPFDEQD